MGDVVCDEKLGAFGEGYSPRDEGCIDCGDAEYGGGGDGKAAKKKNVSAHSERPNIRKCFYKPNGVEGTPHEWTMQRQYGLWSKSNEA